MSCGECETKDAEILRLKSELDVQNYDERQKKNYAAMSAEREGKIRELRLRAIGVAAQLERIATSCSLAGNPEHWGTGDDLKRLAKQLETEDPTRE